VLYYFAEFIKLNMSIRTDRAAKEVQRAMSEILMPFASQFHAGLITVTSVKMSPDLRIANTYLSIFGGQNGPEEVLSGLKNVRGEIRSKLGSKIKMRFVPEVRMFLDDTLEQIEHIQDLVEKAGDKEHPIDESVLSRRR
jgi:ribosome-binding factor A